MLLQSHVSLLFQILEAADKIQALDMKKHALSIIVHHFSKVCLQHPLIYYIYILVWSQTWRTVHRKFYPPRVGTHGINRAYFWNALDNWATRSIHIWYIYYPSCEFRNACIECKYIKILDTFCFRYRIKANKTQNYLLRHTCFSTQKYSRSSYITRSAPPECKKKASKAQICVPLCFKRVIASWLTKLSATVQCVVHRHEPVLTLCVACSYLACVIVGRRIGSGVAHQLSWEP